jgi:nucleoside-diphosphate-sugar epimerase
MHALVGAARPDAAIHLASLFRAEHRPEEIAPMVAGNVLFGAQLADALAAHGCTRLINTGTAWQYYEGRDYDPVCLYAATKQAFEAMLAFYVNARGLSVVTLELFDTYGPDDPRGKLVSALFGAARNGRHLDLSPGEQKIDLVHVADVVGAYRAALQHLFDEGAPATGTFMVSSGEPVSLRELVALVEEASGSRIDARWGKRPYRDREVMTPWSGGRTLPGWRPRIGLREGLKELAAANV